MEGFLQQLCALPVLGVGVQLLGYLVEQLPFISHAAVQLAIPIALASMTGILCERSGVINVGLEGIMLTCAFVGYVTAALATALLGGGVVASVFGVTLPLLLALGAAILAGVLISLLEAWLSISIRANQIVVGTIINIAAVGLTGYLNTLLLAQPLPSPSSLEPLVLPSSVTHFPLVGWSANAFLGQGPIAILTIVVVIAFQLLLFRSRWGLHTRAVGEHPLAADTVGIDVIRVRYRNVIMSGAFASLGGAYLSLEITNSFQDGMTAGRGFIGLAAVIVGRWTPVGGFLAALLFASSQAMGQSIAISPASGDLGHLLSQIPPQFFDALPYLITIVVLAGLVGRSVGPAAVGQPYQREASS